MASLRAIEPDITVEDGSVVVSEDALRASPGMDPRHYAPRAALLVIEGRAEAVRVADARAATGRVGLVVRGDAGPGSTSVEARVLPDAAANARDLPPFFEHVVQGPHSVVTVHLVDEAGQPTRAARDEILAFLARRLRPP